MTITINGIEYPLHFGMKALEIFFKSSGVTEEGSLFHAEQLTAIVWGGLQNGAYRLQKSLSLSFAEVVDWVDGQLLDPAGQKTLMGIAAAFNESQAVKSMAQKSDEGKKKKGSTLKAA